MGSWAGMAGGAADVGGAREGARVLGGRPRFFGVPVGGAGWEGRTAGGAGGGDGALSMSAAEGKVVGASVLDEWGKTGCC